MRGLTLRGVAFSSLFAALVVVFGFVSIPLGFTPVPITLQTLAVMLAGGLLGAGYGFFSLFIVVALTALGFPLLGGKGGISVLMGPTAGYVWMWPIAALLIGWIVQKLKQKGVVEFLLIFLAMEVFGSLLLYVSGVPWLAHVAKLPFDKAMVAGCYPYLPGDAIKALAATVIVISLRRVFPVQRLIGSSSSVSHPTQSM
ncbi:biotin transporter BioY [Paenibacillus silviterrae]|uniref:biotin transporter BioY n=1 Tax=Paenibacillus silviterrae TaxID=3242194 RepID=UPI002542FDAD|nr:biotin transporter BioY [Paenibacillus chinjuensis]